MIGFFPEPYPDELLYSLCARYSARAGYENKARTLRELFGDGSATAIVDLPCNLLHLIEALPTNDQYTVNRLIDEFTLLPFYSPFLPIERVKKLREYMTSSKGGAVHDSSGIAPSSIRSPKWFRYCPVCTSEDQEKFGEQYWHRLHQIPGVEICPTHQVFLEESNISASNRIRQYEFFEANAVSNLKAPRFIDPSNRFHQVLLKLSYDASWLLAQKELVPGFSYLHSRYMELLTSKGYANKSGIISSNVLTNAFINHFPPESLETLQCSFEKDKPSRWLNVIFSNLRRDKAHHPLRHLLLIQFLDKTAEDFFSISDSTKPVDLPFGEAPWPCLDPTSNHFRKLTVSECRISVSSKTGKTIGRFYCNCGFAYSRIGPDSTLEDKFRSDRFVAASPSWENKLRELWNNPNISVSEIGRQLGVDSMAVKYHASHQGLQFPRLGPYTRQQAARSDAEFILRHQRLQSESLVKLDMYRKEWLEIRKKHPNAKRSELRKEYLLVHDWLYRNDSDWLEAHQPPPHVRTESARKVDWDKRDLELSEKVKAVAMRLKELPGRPVRVTLQAIGTALEQRTLLQKERHKLPLTDRVLVEVIETDEDFAIRRLQWAAECFSGESACPTRTQLISRAGIRSNRIKVRPRVQKAVDRALDLIYQSR